jgi:MSHA pilin protein MshA
MGRKEKGFTIIELVVVIVILGILAAVAFPKFVDLSGDAQQAVVDGTAAAVQSAAVLLYAKNNGSKNSPAAITATSNLDYDSTKITLNTASCSIGVTYTTNTAKSRTVDVSNYCQ